MAEKIKIAQLDYYTGEIIEVYESISDAAWDNYIEYSAIKDSINKRNGMMKIKKLRFKIAD